MARVTRSKKIDISEDHSAKSFETQPSDVHQLQTRPVSNIINTMSPPIKDAVVVSSKEVESENGNAKVPNTRGKSVKGRKKDKQDLAVQPDTINKDGSSNDNQLIDAVEQPSGPVTPELHVAKRSARTTRRQAAKQAGQYNTLASTDAHSGMSQKIRQMDFLSLFAGRLASQRSSRSASCATILANNDPLLAEDNQNVAMEQVSPIQTYNTSSKIDTTTLDASDSSQKLENINNSPTKSHAKTLEEVEQSETFTQQHQTPGTEVEEDSFVEQIIARSPAKLISRIEDSVEALDQLEEALEAIDEATIAESIASHEHLTEQAQPQKQPLKAQGSQPAAAKMTGHTTVHVKPVVAREPTVKKARSMVLKPTSKPAPAKNERTAQCDVKPYNKRPMSVIIQKEPTVTNTIRRSASVTLPKSAPKVTKQTTKANFELPGEAIARRIKEQREARKAQRESSGDICHTASTTTAKIKSTKPLTKPIFELPGEVLSRKKREKIEARRKAEENEERRRREFRAKPVQTNTLTSFVPRDTIASRARQSKIGIEVENDDKSKTSQRGSNIGAHRPLTVPINTANMSAPRAKGPVMTRKTSPVQSAKSTGTPPIHLQRTVSAGEIQLQRQRAKGIYNRDAKLAEEMEREKREREAAARRAREEAAERGRQASREWAEKQLAKKMIEGDKGMGPGFGPGGQLGLKL